MLVSVPTSKLLEIIFQLCHQRQKNDAMNFQIKNQIALEKQANEQHLTSHHPFLSIHSGPTFDCGFYLIAT
jgi:hypothetical protein